MHNYLRITRILKFLADLEMDSEQLKFLDALRMDIFVERKLKPLAESFCRYWIHTLKNDEVRKEFITQTKEIIKTSKLKDLD